METSEGSDFATGEEMQGHVQRYSKHGHEYKTLQFILVLLRALRHETREFGLASDIKGGEKFDDIVCTRPKDEGNGRSIRFIQVKYGLDRSKGILLPHLLSEGKKDPFSLQKCFTSFVGIKKNEYSVGLMKPNDSVEDLVILTNYGFEYGGKSGALEMKEDIFENLGEDKLFANSALKFRSEFKGRRELVLILKKGLVDMPHRFSRSVTSGKEYTYMENGNNQPESELYSNYWNVLTTEVLNDGGNKFLSSFIGGGNLSQAASHFREELYSKYHKSNANGNEESFRRYMKEISIKSPKKRVFKDNSKNMRYLAEKIVKLLKDHRDRKIVNITVADANILNGNFLIPTNGVFAFRTAFLDGNLPHKLNEFKDILLSSGIDVDELKEYKFRIFKGFVREKVPETAEELDFEVEEFLSKVKFVLNQRGMPETKKMLLQEVAYSLGFEYIDAEIEKVYSRLYYKVYEWMGTKTARFLMRKDLEKFFKERKEEIECGIRFQLRDPEADCVFRGKLESIKTFFKQEGHSVKKCLVLRGLGGMGKTELAKEYAQLTRKTSYDHTIWINSRSVERFERSLRDLAINRLSGESSIVCAEGTETRELLKTLFAYFIQKRTLFIFDDAREEMKKYIIPSLSDVIARNGYLHILVTSECGNWDGFTIENLEQFTEEEAYDFVKQLAGDTSRYSEQDVRVLCEKLSYYPLALKLAASYIIEKDNCLKDAGRCFPITKYLELLEEESTSIDACGTNENESKVSVKSAAKTLKITFKEIEKAYHKSLANHLLSIMSYLMPDNIPVAVLRTPEFKYTPDDLGSCIKVLKSYSVLTVNNAKVSMHPVVQEVIRHSLRAEGGEEEALKHAIPVCRLMGIEHRMSVWRYAKDHRSLTELCSDIPSNVTIILCDTHMPNRAKNFARAAMEKMMENPGRTHKDTISLRIALCYAHKILGRRDKCARLTKKIVSDLDAVKDASEIKKICDGLKKSQERLPEIHEIKRITSEILNETLYNKLKLISPKYSRNHRIYSNILRGTIC